MNTDSAHDNYNELKEQYGFDIGDEGDIDKSPGGLCFDHVDPFDPARPIVLVELSARGDDRVWITNHLTAQDAVDAHTDQEYRDDWVVDQIADVYNGVTYIIEHRAVKDPT